MKMQFLDIVVAKEFETVNEGNKEKKTQWNRVGRAWASKNGEAMNLELFMYPGQFFSVPYNTKKLEDEVQS
jgi:hypothetical protein